MDSTLVRLIRRQNGLPAKAIACLMIVCLLLQAAPGAGTAATDGSFDMKSINEQYSGGSGTSDTTTTTSDATTPVIPDLDNLDDGTDTGNTEGTTGLDGVNDTNNPFVPGEDNNTENPFGTEGVSTPDGVGSDYDFTGLDSGLLNEVYYQINFIDDHIQYILGYPDGTVRPDNSITRAEVAAIFHRLLAGSNKYEYTQSTFTDLSESDWFYQPLAYLEKMGIVYGYPDGTFRPYDTITRAEYAAFISRIASLNQAEGSVFTDVNEQHWAYYYINSTAAKGWVNGDEAGLFQPEATITRSQVVTIANRILNREIRLENIPVDAPRYQDLQKDHWAYSAIVEASDSHQYERMGDNSELWVGRIQGL